MVNGLRIFVSLLGFAVFASHVGAQSKSGVSPQAVSLPSGPGAISGMGESFDVQLNTGTLTFSIPFRSPPGVAGTGPGLTLVYNPGVPNGPFGPGWALSTMAVQRRTDDGQPSYTDGDTFSDFSGEKLIRMEDGSYRRELELDGLFAHVERWGDGWRHRSKSGTTILLGQYPNVSNPARRSRVGRDDASFDETLVWLADEIIDVNGNRVQFFYTQFSESPGVLYLDEVRYSEFGTNYHAILFDYELRADREDLGEGRAGIAMYTGGFPQIYGHRCAAVRVMTSGQPVRKYTFDYQLDPEDELLAHPDSMPMMVARLRRITEWDSTFTSYLPPLTIYYSEYEPSAARIFSISNAPWLISASGHNGVELFDVNGNGLPDLLNGSIGGNWDYALNRIGLEFDPVIQEMTNSPGYPLSSASAQLVDFNADGFVDIANKSSANPLDFYAYQLYRGNGMWEDERTFDSNPPFTYNDPDIALLDVDFDKDIDVMYFHSGGQIIYYQEDGVWSTRDRSWADPDLADLPTTLRFSQPNIRLADLNGDRLLDIVQLTKVGSDLEVAYWPNMGHGKFGDRKLFDRTFYVHSNFDNLLFMDVNGDGLTDMVTVLSDEVEVRFNRGDGTWTDEVLVDAPHFNSFSVALRPADMNANGSTDLMYSSPVDGVEYLDFIGTNVLPGQIIAVDSGLGRRTHVHYRSVADYMAEAESAGRPWTKTIPFPMQVVSGYDIQIGLDMDGHPGPDKYPTRIRYRDPYYDAYRKEFRGFTFVEKIEHGDEYYGVTNGAAPGLVTRIAYHPGIPMIEDESQIDWSANHTEHALKGMILWRETTDVGVNGSENWPYTEDDFLPEQYVYNREIHHHGVFNLHAVSNALLSLLPADPGDSVRFPAQTNTIGEIIEKGVGAKRTIRTSTAYDAYGNTSQRIEWGDITPGPDQNEPRITHMEYAYDEISWMLDRLERVWITDGQDQWLKETRFTYDELGRLEQTDAYLDESTFFPTLVVEHDEYGNITKRTDARGYSIHNQYEPVFHTFSIRESVEVGFGRDDLVVETEYDFRFGVPTRMVDYNGNETFNTYDSFGRLTSIVTPGDTLALPTKSFSYVICDDLAGVCYDYLPSGALQVSTGHAPGSVSSRIHSYQRVQFGHTNTIETILYIDAMGRELASRIQDDDGFVTSRAFNYNVRGGNRINFLPHESVASLLPDSADVPHSTFRHDAMSRALEVRLPPDPDGIEHFATTIYEPLRTASLDFEATVAGGRHENITRVIERDGLGRQRRLIEHNEIGEHPGAHVTTFTYDLRDSLVEVVDAQGNVKTMEYDGWGRKVATHDPNAGAFIYIYDLSGNLIETEDAKGQRNVYAYDGANRILSEDHGGNGTLDVVYHYDAPSPDYPLFGNMLGRPGRVDDLSGSWFFSYDARGNVNQSVKRVKRRAGHFEDYSFSATYDAMNRTMDATFPDGDRLSYFYNQRGLLREIPGIVSGLVYNAAGERLSMTLANGATTTYEYDERFRLRHLNTVSPMAGLIQHLTYTLDGANNMVDMEDGRALSPSSPRNMTQQFWMDDLYRLVQTTGTGYGTIHNSYDKLGNMISQSSPDISDPRVNHGVRSFGGAAGTSGRTGRQPGDAPGPHALTGTANGYSVAYDDNGNMTQARGNTYTWDTLNRLASVSSPSGTLHFVYDYRGSRVLKYLEEDTDDETVYVTPSYELRANKAIKFIFAGPVRVARVEGPLPIPERVTQQELLQPGWNLVPINVLPTNTAPGYVFASIEGQYTGIYEGHQNGYLKFVPSAGDNDLTVIQAGWSYWVHVNEPCTLVLSGERYAPPNMPMFVGWQFVALGGHAPQSLSELVASNAHIMAVWKFDNLLKKYLYHEPGTGAPSTLTGALPSGAALLLRSATASPLKMAMPERRVFFYHADHLGSGNIVTDEAGLVVEELYYYPFGLQRHRHAPNGDIYRSEYGFSDKELDTESGLMYFEARYYDPILCVFISIDPVALHSPSVGARISIRLNAYAYAGNNPLILVDPDGQIFFIAAAIIIAQVATYAGATAIAAAVIAGAIVGAASAAYAGGDITDILQGAFIGAIGGVIGYGIGQGVGGVFEGLGATGPPMDMASGLTLSVERVASGAVQSSLTSYLSGGVMSLITEGSWRNMSFNDMLQSVAISAATSYRNEIRNVEQFNNAVDAHMQRNAIVLAAHADAHDSLSPWEQLLVNKFGQEALQAEQNSKLLLGAAGTIVAGRHMGSGQDFANSAYGEAVQSISQPMLERALFDIPAEINSLKMEEGQIRQFIFEQGRSQMTPHGPRE